MKEVLNIQRGAPKGRYNNSENVGDLGYLLGTTRSVKGLSLKEVSTRIGMNFTQLSNIEHGIANLPHKYLDAICEVLDLNKSIVASYIIQNSYQFKKTKQLLKKGE